MFMQLTRDLFAIAKFLLKWVRRLTHVIAIGWTSVCLSVCLSHAGIVSKWLNLSSDCLHCLVAP